MIPTQTNSTSSHVPEAHVSVSMSKEVARLKLYNQILGFVDPLLVVVVVVVVESYFKMEIWCFIHSFNGKIF